MIHRYEYQTLKWGEPYVAYSQECVLEDLRNLGQEGWELVSIQTSRDQCGGVWDDYETCRAWLKREIDDEVGAYARYCRREALAAVTEP